VGVLAGSYPAFLLSSLRPVSSLRGGPAGVRRNSLLRGILVVGQFAVAICLIIGTVTIYRQLNFMRTADLGFNAENLVVLPNPGAGDHVSTETVRQELLSVPGVTAVAAASSAPGEPVPLTNCWPQGGTREQESQLMNVMAFDAHYIPTAEVELVAGRGFSTELQTDRGEAALINETGAEAFGWDDPIGKVLERFETTPDGPVVVSRRIVGVMRDMHLYSLHSPIDPLLVSNESAGLGRMIVRVAPGSAVATTGALRDRWSELYPDLPFDHRFVADTFQGSYEADRNLANLALSFSVLALGLGCLGLFGMSSYAALRRTKEIGIRKVLGATSSSIVRLLSREALVLVVVANVIAWPVAHVLMSRWLESFPYRVDLAWLVFLLAGLGAAAVAQSTVAVQGLAAARRDPVHSLRYE
jgi:putative ABC transport system permease protein